MRKGQHIGIAQVLRLPYLYIIGDLRHFLLISVVLGAPMGTRLPLGSFHDVVHV